MILHAHALSYLSAFSQDVLLPLHLTKLLVLGSAPLDTYSSGPGPHST